MFLRAIFTMLFINSVKSNLLLSSPKVCA